MMISVCICTYSRGVIDTLSSIAAQWLLDGTEIEAVVVDNDEKCCGEQIVVENSAIVRECIPPERLSATYLCRQALRAGQSYGVIRLRTLSQAGRAVFLAAALVKIAVFAIAADALCVFARVSVLKPAIRSWLNFGKLRALAGNPVPSFY